MKKMAYYGLSVLVVVGVLVALLQNGKQKDSDAKIASESAKPTDNTNAAFIDAIATEKTTQKISVKKSSASSSKNAQNYHHIEELLAAMQERRNDMTFDPAEVAAAVERKAAWQPLEAEVPKELPLTPEELADGREFIHFDVMKLETLMPGDSYRVSLQETNRDYNVIIDDVEKNQDTISWNGHIETTDGQTYLVSFSRGNFLTVGGMDTPEGHYVIQAHGDKGWVASSALLFKNHVDPIDPKDVVPSE